MGATSFNWGRHRGDAEGSHLACDAVLFDEWFLLFWNVTVPSSLGVKQPK